MREHGSRALIVSGDLTEVAVVRRLFAETRGAFDRVDIVINNAGVIVKKPILYLSR